ncbi:hypothetical protein Lal_00026748 [Lupinus albus]|uniref:Uncharacterized protein n=1 Tax=Lupinus albus TaxID=3870 RepID=A0A6A4Q134_LUPAL|nr:hypothetical protein Lalb_Chr09g0332351 [Lupinus albus]KAF1862224.1 hypothetical protein Lal_00026748 [Lupinus albus]
MNQWMDENSSAMEAFMTSTNLSFFWLSTPHLATTTTTSVPDPTQDLPQPQSPLSITLQARNATTSSQGIDRKRQGELNTCYLLEI